MNYFSIIKTTCIVIIVLLSFVGNVEPAKIIMFVPTLCNSELIFNNRIADTLSDAGHEVTLYLPQMLYESELNRTRFVRKGKPFLVPGDSGETWHEMEETMLGYTFTDFSLLDKRLLKQVEQMRSVFLAACEVQVRNAAALDTLRSARFDIAIGHIYDLCWLGLAELIGVRSVVWASSAPSAPLMGLTAGVPLAGGYVAGDMPGQPLGYGDELTFGERSANLLFDAVIAAAVPRIEASTTDVFRRHASADFPDLVELLRDRVQLHLINSIVQLDYARPNFAHYVHIGGLGFEEAKPLDKKWSKVYDAAESGVIFISFGSVATAKSMPDSWKGTIVAAAKALPDCTFIWKYDSRDIYGKFDVPDNVIVSNWLPQRDLLGDRRTLAFVTHGGQTSLLDAALSAAPVVVVPLMGDQFHNAAVACRRHGIGLCIGSKADMAERPDVFINAVRDVARSDSYRIRAARLSSMLLRRPHSAERLLADWVGYLAEFGELELLKSDSRRMHWARIMSYDVLAAFMVVVQLVLFGLVMLVWKCCCRKAPRADDKRKAD